MSRKYLVQRCLASILSIVVALAVAAHGVAILVWVVDLARSWDTAIGALVLFGVVALIAAPTGLYRNEEVRGAALLCAGLFVCTAGVFIFWAWVGEAMKDIGPAGPPWPMVGPTIVTALSAAAILVCKVRSGQKLGRARRPRGGAQ